MSFFTTAKALAVLAVPMAAGLVGWACIKLSPSEFDAPQPAAAPIAQSRLAPPVASTEPSTPEAPQSVTTTVTVPPVPAAEAMSTSQAMERLALIDPKQDLQAALQASFDVYDERLAQPAVTPAWWGNRNVQAEIAALDPMVNVAGIRCTQAMCGVDLVFQEPPSREEFDQILLNQPSLQGSLIKRMEDDPRKLRVYLFESEMEAPREGDSVRPPRVASDKVILAHHQP